MSDEDFQLHQIPAEFLKFVEKRHAELGHSTDYRELARKLGIRIVFGDTNQAANQGEHRLIIIDEKQTENRSRFTGLHEIAHHLLEEAEEGLLKASLKDIFYHGPSAAKAFEEILCDAAASLLLMPTHLLKEAINTHGHTPLASLFLVRKTGASVQAAMRRVIWQREVRTFGVLLGSNGLVVDSINHCTKYSIRRNSFVEPEHPLMGSGFSDSKIEEFDATVPFATGRRDWKMRALACCDDQGRTLAFLMDARHVPRRDSNQTRLF